jgi:hypothetical protein
VRTHTYRSPCAKCSFIRFCTHFCASSAGLAGFVMSHACSTKLIRVSGEPDHWFGPMPLRMTFCVLIHRVFMLAAVDMHVHFTWLSDMWDRDLLQATQSRGPR